LNDIIIFVHSNWNRSIDVYFCGWILDGEGSDEIFDRFNAAVEVLE
jgi:hypothetical protein